MFQTISQVTLKNLKKIVSWSISTDFFLRKEEGVGKVIGVQVAWYQQRDVIAVSIASEHGTHI
jgi:hypothetical protein